MYSIGYNWQKSIYGYHMWEQMYGTCSWRNSILHVAGRASWLPDIVHHLKVRYLFFLMWCVCMLRRCRVCTLCFILNIDWMLYAVPEFDFLSGSIRSVQLDTAAVCRSASGTLLKLGGLGNHEHCLQRSQLALWQPARKCLFGCQRVLPVLVELAKVWSGTSPPIRRNTPVDERHWSLKPQG